MNILEIIKRFIIFTFAVLCAAGLICGIITAKANTERRLTGEEAETVTFSLEKEELYDIIDSILPNRSDEK